MRNISIFILLMFIFSGCAQKPKQAEMPVAPEEIFDEAESLATTPEVTQLTNVNLGTPNLPATPAVSVNQPQQSQQPVNLVSEKSINVSQAGPVNVSSGDQSAENIQKALQNAGMYQGKVDGKIGPRTKKAIEDFQKQNGLYADGKVGPKTWSKLKSFLNPTLASSSSVSAE